MNYIIKLTVYDFVGIVGNDPLSFPSENKLHRSETKIHREIENERERDSTSVTILVWVLYT